jgi:ABC-type multidrug transport system fused ATPase/permease subunit
MSRRKKILFSGFLALGFLVLRLSYAFVFAGLAGGQVILSLPEIRLAGPFSHVRLFGEVGVDGIIRNLETAIPFALSILLFGIVASFITPQNLRVLANKIPPIRNLVSAIAIGLNSLPALFEASRKVLEARQLRGEKRSQLLVPILERSVELANAIGMKLALEPAGNQRATSLSVHELAVPDCNLGPVSFQLSAGQIMVLSGATGSGKSTLLEAIAGILSEYRGREVSGEVAFDGKNHSRLARSQAFFATYPRTRGS